MTCSAYRTVLYILPDCYISRIGKEKKYRIIPVRFMLKYAYMVIFVKSNSEEYVLRLNSLR